MQMRSLRPSADGRSQLARKAGTGCKPGLLEEGGEPQHSQGRVGVDQEGGRARFSQSHEDPVTDHCQDVCIADAYTPCLIFDVWHANLTLPVQLPVEGREVSLRAGGDMPQINRFAEGPTANQQIYTSPIPLAPFSTEISRRVDEGLRGVGSCMQPETPHTWNVSLS